MKQKSLVTLALGIGLIGAAFFLARRASAATIDSGAGGPAAAAAVAAGATGALTPEVRAPLAFEGRAPIPGITPTKFNPNPITPRPLAPAPPAPAPATPRPIGGGYGGAGRERAFNR